MKSLIKILGLISCALLTSCFTVIETTTDNDDYYIDYCEPIIVITQPPDIYINYPVPEPREQKQETYKERKNTRPSNGTTIRDAGRQRSSKINGNENRDDKQDRKNVQQNSKSQRR